MVSRLLLIALVASALAWQEAPPAGKISARSASDLASNHSQAGLYVNTLQASGEFASEAHNGVGWTSTLIAPGTNYFCSLTYTQSVGVSVGCMVYYAPNSEQLFFSILSFLSFSI